jgi:hypothetical protein
MEVEELLPAMEINLGIGDYFENENTANRTDMQSNCIILRQQTSKPGVF